MRVWDLTDAQLKHMRECSRCQFKALGGVVLCKRAEKLGREGS